MQACRDELLTKHQEELLSKKSGIGALLEQEASQGIFISSIYFFIFFCITRFGSTISPF